MLFRPGNRESATIRDKARLAPTKCVLGSGEVDGGAGLADGVPGEGGGDDEVVVEAGGRAVTITTGGQAFHAVSSKFAEEGFIG